MSKYTKSKEAPVEILVIADRSGSMSSIRSDAIGGFNTFLKEQQKVEGEATLTLVLFDDQYEVPVNNCPIDDVLPLTESTFVPRGMTAMNDAIGKALNDLITKNPEKAIICVLTDGMENASREYNNDYIKSLIEKCSNEKGWEFIYLAANQDTFSEGRMRGFRNLVDYDATGQGIRSAYASMADTATSYRTKSAEVSNNG